MKRIAIVGLGKMGIIHASMLNVMPDVELVAFCEKIPLVRRYSPRVFKKIKMVSDIKDLSSFNLDAIYVTTPTSTHLPVVSTIYADKLAPNLFVEKPLTSGYTDSEALCNLAKNHSGVQMVGYNRRFIITFKKAKQIVDEGTLGELISFEAYAYSPDFLGATDTARPIALGGVLRDLGCHAIDLILWFFGVINIETAHIGSIIGNNSEDSVKVKVKNAAGLTGELKCSWCMERQNFHGIGLTISGSKGTLQANEDKVVLKLSNGKSFQWYKQDLNDNVPFMLAGTDYFREDQYLIKSITDGSAVEPNFKTALEVDRIIEQVRKKARGDNP